MKFIKNDYNDNFMFNCLQVINEVLLNNINKELEGSTQQDDYFKIPSLSYLFDIVVLTLLYHNDLITRKQLTKKGFLENDNTYFAYRYNQSNKVLTEAVKMFQFSINLRNLCHKMEVSNSKKFHKITIDYFFYDLKFFVSHNSPCSAEYYESQSISNSIMKIFELLIGDFNKGNFKIAYYISNYITLNILI